MRILHAGPDHERDRPDQRGTGRGRSGARARGHERKSLPLRCLRRHRRRRPGCTAGDGGKEPEGNGMNTFDYRRPETIAEAVAAASQPGAAYLAAGTNLLDLMKGGVSRPARLVDITHLPGLAQITTLPDGGGRIG